jgi:transcriptional antiterminator NusG
MSDNLNWHAIYVRSRHEFVAHSELRRKGIESFLPSVLKVRQWKDRKKEIPFALFPGYLFVHIEPNPEEYRTVLKTAGVVTFVCLEKGDPAPVPSEDIISLKAMIESGRELDIYPHLKEGGRVRVRRGPLYGAEGVLLKKEGRRIFIINVDILGRSVGVEISADDIEAA